MTTLARAILLHAADDVATCIEDVPAGTEVAAGDRTVTALQAIPAGHKVAIADIARGSMVHKYGQAIGRASASIRAGEHVHVHNLDSARAGGPQ